MTALLDSLKPWHLWAAAAILLAAVEMLSLTFYLLCFAIAAIPAAIVASCGAPTTVQLTVFAIGGLLCILALRRLGPKRLYGRSEDKPVNTAGMIGLVGIVTEPIGSLVDAGRVKIRGEEWRALSEENCAIPEGANVTVVSVAGASINVRVH